jgi:hypothetical protein
MGYVQVEDDETGLSILEGGQNVFSMRWDGDGVAASLERLL